MKMLTLFMVSLFLFSGAGLYAGEPTSDVNAEILKELRELRQELKDVKAELATLKPLRKKPAAGDQEITPDSTGVEWPTQYSEDETTNKELHEINRTLHSIRSELAALKKISEEDQEEDEEWDAIFEKQNSRRPEGANLKLLRKIKLPKDATEDEAEEYIDKIIMATEGQRSFSEDDPQVMMFMKVGGDRLSLLIRKYQENMSRMGSHLLNKAIQQLTGEEHKELILEALPDCSQLATIILQKGWEEDAREILLDGLKSAPGHVRPDWIKAVASFKDPETYNDLTACMVNTYNRNSVYLTISKLPGIELEEAVAEAWERAKNNDWYQRLDTAKFAVLYGHIDALEALVEILVDENQNRMGLIRQIRPVVLRHINFRGTNQEIFDWYNKNHLSLVFDEKTKKYVVDKEKRDKQEGVEVEEF